MIYLARKMAGQNMIQEYMVCPYHKDRLESLGYEIYYSAVHQHKDCDLCKEETVNE